jgi:hypothetical protein
MHSKNASCMQAEVVAWGLNKEVKNPMTGSAACNGLPSCPAHHHSGLRAFCRAFWLPGILGGGALADTSQGASR